MQPPGVDGKSFKAWFVRRCGITRRVAVTTYGFVTLPALVVGTNDVATAHARLAPQFTGSWPLVARQPPLQIEPMQQSVQWHQYRTQDPGPLWLRGLLRRAVARMDATQARFAPTRSTAARVARREHKTRPGPNAARPAR